MQTQKIAIKTVLVVVTLCCLASCSSYQNIAGIKASGLGDPLEKLCRISTYGYTKPFLIQVGKHDEFFRCFINKKTQAATYQLYISIISRYGFENWNKARFKTPNGLVEMPAERISYSAEVSQYGNSYEEDIGVSLTRDILESWKEEAATIRLDSGRSTATHDIKLDPKEVFEFLKLVDEKLQIIKSNKSSDASAKTPEKIE